MAFNNWCAHFFDVINTFASTYHDALAFIGLVLGVLWLFAFLLWIWRFLSHV